MKKLLLLIQVFALWHPAFSQSRQHMPHALQLTAARSFHGTGDLSGMSFDVSYEYSFSRRLDLTNGLTTTIHAGKDNKTQFIISEPNQPDKIFETPDQSLLRYTTAGIQLTSVLNFNFIALPKHKIRLGCGPVLRYESSSTPKAWGYTFIPAENPLPEYTFNEYGGLHQLSVGYNLGLSYLFQISSHYQMGVKANFQNDTNGSVITNLGLVIGRYMQF